MEPEPVELLRGKDIVVTTRSVRKGNEEWLVNDLSLLQIRTLEGHENVGLQVFLIGVAVAILGQAISGIYGLIVGGVIILLAPYCSKRMAICYLLVRPETKDDAMAVIYSNTDRKQVERLRQAIEIARSWPEYTRLGSKP